MKKLMDIIGASAIAALLYMAPVSLHWSPVNEGVVMFGIAHAADLEIPRHRHAYRSGYYRYSHVGFYDPLCGGPYVGGGWNGGTYYGGPWIDLRCYGLLVVR